MPHLLNNMNRIDRLFGILTLLQSKKYVTAEHISEKFGMSIRTVYRDIKAIGEQGVPVSFEPGRGYFIMQGYFLPPVSFTSEEANALLLMEYLIKGFADRSIQTHYSTALSKVKSVLRGPQKETLEQLHQSMKLQLPSSLNHDFEYLALLQKAVSNRTLIRLEYKNMNNETSTRLAEPVGLVFYAFNWHLFAWCHLRNEYRDFRVSRMVSLTCTAEPFRKTDHVGLDEFMKNLPVNY